MNFNDLVNLFQLRVNPGFGFLNIASPRNPGICVKVKGNHVSTRVCPGDAWTSADTEEFARVMTAAKAAASGQEFYSNEEIKKAYEQSVAFIGEYL